MEQKQSNLIILNEIRKNGRIYYRCKCICGNIKEIRKDKFLFLKSCGCMKNIRNSTSIYNEKFGLLKVLNKSVERKKGNILYDCLCDCGNHILATKRELIRKDKTRCEICADKYIKIRAINNLYKKGVEPFLFDGTHVNLIKSKKLNTNNTSGKKGVTYDKERQKWRAQIGFKNKTIKLGRFNSKEEAQKARLEAEEKYYKKTIDDFNKKE